jgi:hypothetical protein
MNERIKELSEQATTVIEATEHSGEGWIFNKEKFALLIIEECVKIADGEWADPGYQIKQHFGVE